MTCTSGKVLKTVQFYLTSFYFFKGLHQSDTFERSYHIGNILGKGGFGTVYSGVRVCDGVLVSSEP